MNTLEKTFNASLRRDSKIITVDSTEKQEKVMFRKNTDGNSDTDRSYIFYSKDTQIRQGSIITYNSKKYLVLNQETSENEVYLKSSIVATNGILNDNNKEYRDIPCYCNKGLTSSLLTENEVLALLDGNVELLTEDNDASRSIRLCSRFMEFGGTYEVINKFYKDGIAHIYARRTTDEVVTTVYKVLYTGATSVSVSDGTYQLVFKAYKDDVEDTTATFEYSSSNGTIATVDSNGLMTLVKDGEVTITAKWVEQDVTCDTTITITASNPTPVIIGTSEITYSGLAEIKSGARAKSFTAVFYDNDGNVVTGVKAKWTIVAYSTSNVLSDLVVNPYSDTKVKISVNNDSLIGESFTLRLEDENGQYTYTDLKIDIIEYY